MNDKHKIVKKVVKLYMKYGLRSVTMDDVAKELGISKKTLYQQFKDKNELVKLCVMTEVDYMKGEIEVIRSEDLNPIEELLRVNRLINSRVRDINLTVEFELNKYYRQIHDQALDMRRKAIYKMMYTNMERGVVSGYYRNEIDIDIIAKLHISRVENIIDNDILCLEEFTAPRFFNELFVYHIRGISSAKGIEYLENRLKELKLKTND